MYFVFYVPTRWTDQVNRLGSVLAPILEKSGFPTDAEGMTFITDIEATFTFEQFKPGKEGIQKYFQTENRCMMYDISVRKKSILMSPVYFQFKQDDTLRLFDNDRYFTPKVLKIHDTHEFKFDHMDAKVKDVISKVIGRDIDDTLFCKILEVTVVNPNYC